MNDSMEENSGVTANQSTQVVNPGSKITTVKLGDDNFLLGKFQILAALEGNGLEAISVKKVKHRHNS